MGAYFTVTLAIIICAIMPSHNYVNIKPFSWDGWGHSMSWGSNSPKFQNQNLTK